MLPRSVHIAHAVLVITVVVAFDGIENVAHSEGVAQPRFIVALILASLACSLSLSAGVGGGGVLVPIFNIVLGSPLKQATALSQAVIAASGIGSAVFNFTHGRPDHPDCPLSDVHLALALAPALLLGVSFGVLANTLAPSWLIALILLVLLAWVAWRTWASAVRLRKAEKRGRAELEAPLEENGSSDTQAEQGTATPQRGSSSPRFVSRVAAPSVASRPTIPIAPVIKLVVTWALFTALGLLRGRFQRCTTWWTVLYAAQMLLAGVLTILFAEEVKVATSLDAAQDGIGSSSEFESIQQPLLDATTPGTDRQEPCSPLSVDGRAAAVAGSGPEGASRSPFAAAADSPRAVRHKLSNLALLGGVAAGGVAALVGLGGGILISPLLLELGVPPQVSSATSALLVLFASASATVAFAAEGRLDLDLAATFGTACGVAAFIGVFILSGAVKRHGASVVVFLLSAMTALGAIATAVFNGPRVFEDVAAGRIHGFHPLCQNVTLQNEFYFV